MQDPAKKWFDAPGLIDPATGTAVIEPPGTGLGYWAGALIRPLSAQQAAAAGTAEPVTAVPTDPEDAL